MRPGDRDVLGETQGLLMGKSVLVTLLLVSGGAFAQSISAPSSPAITTAPVLVNVPETGRTVFDWPAIEKCALDPKAMYYAYCRSWRDARDEGRANPGGDKK